MAVFATPHMTAVGAHASAIPAVAAIAPITIESRFGRLLSLLPYMTTGPNAANTEQKTSVTTSSTARRDRGRRSQWRISSSAVAVGTRSHRPMNGLWNITGSV